MAKKKRSRPIKGHQDHDSLFRGAFSMRPIAEAHLRHVLSDQEIQALDLQSLNLISGSFLDEDLSKYASDICWRCSFNEGGEVMISFLFEHKSSLPNETIFVQLLSYLLGVWRLDVSEKRPLSFIVPLIVYHGREKWEVKSFWETFSGVPDIFRRYLPEFEYVFTGLNEVPDAVIIAKEGLGALRSIYLAFKYAFDEKMLVENFQEVLIFVQGLGNPTLDQLLLEMVFTYVQRRLMFEPEEIEILITSFPKDKKDMVMTTYDKIIAKGKNIGFEQGIEQGIEQGKREVVVSLILNTNWDDARIALVTNVEESFVSKLRAEAFQPDSTKN